MFEKVPKINIRGRILAFILDGLQRLWSFLVYLLNVLSYFCGFASFLFKLKTLTLQIDLVIHWWYNLLLYWLLKKRILLYLDNSTLASFLSRIQRKILLLSLIDIRCVWYWIKRIQYSICLLESSKNTHGLLFLLRLIPKIALIL